MEITLDSQRCVEKLEKNKSICMGDATGKLNCKGVVHIYMAIWNEFLRNIKELNNGHEVWNKLMTMYKWTTLVNQVHLMRRLMVARLDDAKFAVEHISTFNGLLNQLQNMGLQIFDDKMKSYFLLMTLLEIWEGSCSLILK